MANPPPILTEESVREIARQEAQSALKSHERVGVLHGVGIVATIGILIWMGWWS